MIEAAMLFGVGFLVAALLALLVLPALSRRAERLARRRVEARQQQQSADDGGDERPDRHESEPSGSATPDLHGDTVSDHANQWAGYLTPAQRRSAVAWPP